MGGGRQRRFAGTNLKPHRLLENAQTPTSRVHAVLGGLTMILVQVFAFSSLIKLEDKVKWLFGLRINATGNDHKRTFIPSPIANKNSDCTFGDNIS